VKIISNQTEYEPLVNWVYGLSEGIFADGEPLYLENGELKGLLGNTSGELPSVIYASDFTVEIDGEYAGKPSYTLYGSEDEELYSQRDSFLPPDNKGEYILCIRLPWSNNDTDKYLEYSGFEYFFKVII
jgi:hypothetical protein